MNHRVTNAIILAAGFGSRFVPYTFEKPKGLMEVCGEVMLERQIKQLIAVGVTDITVVTGYLAEKFLPLAEKYNLKLRYNAEFASKNNLSSLWVVRDLLDSTYILSSDNYLSQNIYHAQEQTSWYALSYANGKTKEWCCELNLEGAITDVTVGGENAWYMYGPVYFAPEFSAKMLPLLERYYAQDGTDNMYWEEVLIKHLDQLEMRGNCQPDNIVYEFESIEELRVFDPSYNDNPANEDMAWLCLELAVKPSQIVALKHLEATETQQTYEFSVESQRYCVTRTLKMDENNQTVLADRTLRAV